MYFDLKEDPSNHKKKMHVVELFKVSSKNPVVFNLIKIRRKNSKTLKKVDKQMLGQASLKKTKKKRDTVLLISNFYYNSINKRALGV